MIISGRLETLDATERLGLAIAEVLKPGMTVALDGELGAGKTTLSRAVVRALGSTTEATSPTFVLCHEYSTAEGLQIEHWDLYRLRQCPDELAEDPPQRTVRLVEWASKAPDLSHSVSLTVNLTLDESGLRTFRLSFSQHTLEAQAASALERQGLRYDRD